MGSGDALGASGGQMTTREAPKTIFASKMGGPGLQKGAKMEAKMLLKIDPKKRCQKDRSGDVKMSPKWRPKGAKMEVKVVQNQLKNTARFYVSKNEDF